MRACRGSNGASSCRRGLLRFRRQSRRFFHELESTPSTQEGVARGGHANPHNFWGSRPVRARALNYAKSEIFFFQRGLIMTAINIIVQKDAVHVLTDTMAYDGFGLPLGTMTKVFPLQHIDAVVALRGPVTAGVLLSTAIGVMGEGFDQVLDRIEERLPIAFAGMQGLMHLCELGTNFDLLFAGISESRGPVAFAICNHGIHKLPKWTLVSVDNLAVAPASPEIIDRVLNEIVKGRDAHDLDPATDGLQILELQRRTAADLHNGVSAVCVGGAAVVTTVTPGAIATRTLRRWPAGAMPFAERAA